MQPSQPNPKRVAAGKANRRLRGPTTEEGLRRLREAIRRVQPWRHSTGPRTEEGKRRSAANGQLHQRGKRSVRQLREELADAKALLRQAEELRRFVTGPTARD